MPQTWQIVMTEGLGGVAEDIFSTITQVIKVAICQQLKISKSETSLLRNQTWFFIPLSCDLKPDITKPTSRKIVVSYETKPSKTDPSSFRKPTHLTKVAHFHHLIISFHQHMPRTWQIFAT